MTDAGAPAWVAAAARPDGNPDGVSLPVRLCRAGTRELGVDGAALSLAGGTGGMRAMVGASDEDAARAEELEVTLGEGPGIEALSHGGPVLVSNLTAVTAARWPAFSAAATDTGFAALFAFPLRLGAAALGVFTLYRRQARALSHIEFAHALRAADAIALLLVGSDGNTLAPGFDGRWLDRSAWTREIDQATGMLTVQLGVGPAAAFARLRAYAFAHDLPLSQVARDVVDRRLRLSDSSGEDGRRT